MELSSRSFSNMQLRKQQPNKRLKLAGADRFKGSGVLCPWRGTDCRPLLLRRRAGRPQLKRDLGRARGTRPIGVGSESKGVVDDDWPAGTGTAGSRRRKGTAVLP